jgi:hypothetical protein
MRWLSSLFLLLAGCAAPTAPPPAFLLQDCPAPAIRARTNGELAATLQDYRYALRACNDDKAALREFAKGAP